MNKKPNTIIKLVEEDISSIFQSIEETLNDLINWVSSSGMYINKKLVGTAEPLADHDLNSLIKNIKDTFNTMKMFYIAEIVGKKHLNEELSLQSSEEEIEKLRQALEKNVKEKISPLVKKLIQVSQLTSNNVFKKLAEQLSMLPSVFSDAFYRQWHIEARTKPEMQDKFAGKTEKYAKFNKELEKSTNLTRKWNQIERRILNVNGEELGSHPSQQGFEVNNDFTKLYRIIGNGISFIADLAPVRDDKVRAVNYRDSDGNKIPQFIFFATNLRDIREMMRTGQYRQFVLNETIIPLLESPQEEKIKKYIEQVKQEATALQSYLRQVLSVVNNLRGENYRGTRQSTPELQQSLKVLTKIINGELEKMLLSQNLQEATLNTLEMDQQSAQKMRKALTKDAARKLKSMIKALKRLAVLAQNRQISAFKDSLEAIPAEIGKTFYQFWHDKNVSRPELQKRLRTEDPSAPDPENDPDQSPRSANRKVVFGDKTTMYRMYGIELLRDATKELMDAGLSRQEAAAKLKPYESIFKKYLMKKHGQEKYATQDYDEADDVAFFDKLAADIDEYLNSLHSKQDLMEIIIEEELDKLLN